MAATDSTEKIDTCNFMSMAGISNNRQPVTKPDAAIHRKKKPGASSSTTNRTRANTHQFQKTISSSVMSAFLGHGFFRQFANPAERANHARRIQRHENQFAVA